MRHPLKSDPLGAQDLFPTLMRFHREIVLPDIERVVGALEHRMNARFDEMNGRFDRLCQPLARLDG